MNELVRLFRELDSTNSTNAKVDALVKYFERAGNRDKVWTIALLSHRRPPRAVNYRLLGEWAAEEAGMPFWLFEESYHVVGDYAETIALLLPVTNNEGAESRSLTDCMELLIDLRGKDESERKQSILEVWRSLGAEGRFLFNKLITGGLRVGVSQKLMTRALARHTDIDENTIALRIMGDWNPSKISFERLIIEANPEDNLSRPYPFYLAHPLESGPEELGDPSDWQVERKWDGIRGQLIVRGGKLYLWSRGEELVTDKYPEFAPLPGLIPDGTVIDGELLAYRDGGPLPFQLMQKRIGRKNVSKKMLRDIPVRMIAYDLIEWEGEDVRYLPLHRRRALLEELLTKCDTAGLIRLSELVQCSSWEDYDAERRKAHELLNEGLMLKDRESAYGVGRKRGDWWKWKVDPFSADAVMIYAQRGHGRRANLFTDFTFAVWDGESLVPFAKAYSGLTNKEFEEISNWVRRNTIERFGPVSSVPAVHVFELHFEGIALSKRHKSGVAVRFPRIHRWRRDKKPEEADSLNSLKKLIAGPND